VRYQLSPRIERDLDEIAEWIAMDNPRRALKVLRELRIAFRRIAQDPLIFRLRPEIGKDARLAVVGHHVVLFWVRGSLVRFERVAYGGRDLPTLYP
jgi:toxin ParE1/3/4